MSGRQGPSGRDIKDDAQSGAQATPSIPRLRSDPSLYHAQPRTLADFRELEGRENRKTRLRELWQKLPTLDQHPVDADDISAPTTVKSNASLTPESAQRMRIMYERELLGSCGGRMNWPEFKKYALEKEVGMSSL